MRRTLSRIQHDRGKLQKLHFNKLYSKHNNNCIIYNDIDKTCIVNKTHNNTSKKLSVIMDFKRNIIIIIIFIIIYYTRVPIGSTRRRYSKLNDRVILQIRLIQEMKCDRYTYSDITYFLCETLEAVLM